MELAEKTRKLLALGMQRDIKSIGRLFNSSGNDDSSYFVGVFLTESGKIHYYDMRERSF